MSEPVLFTPIDIQGLTLPNRIVVAPMCQYSAIDGQMTDWHLVHLGSMALSGAGLLTIEATSVTPDGRISYADVGLWDEQTENAMHRILDVVRATSDVKIAIQLSHAGRKASCEVPWKGGAQIAPNIPNGWQTVSPSDLPFQPTDHAPMRLDREGMVRIRDAFVASAHRAAKLKIDAVQLHAAHGYLLHQFLSLYRTKETIPMEGRSKAGCASHWKCSTPCEPHYLTIRSPFAYQELTGWRMVGTSNRPSLSQRRLRHAAATPSTFPVEE